MLKRILLSSFYLCVMSSLTATWAAAQPFAAAPEMFEHGPPPSDDGPKDRSGTIIGTVKLKADLKNAQEFVLHIPRLPPGRLRVEAVQARSERNYSFRGKGDGTSAELVVTDQGVTGTISVDAASYGLQPLGDGWSVLVRPCPLIWS